MLKEYFAIGFGEESRRSEDNRVLLALGDISSIRNETDNYSYLVKFIDEAETLMFFNRFPGSRFVKVHNVFKSDETNTYYYEMDYCHNGNLEDYLRDNGPMPEDELIRRIIVPVAEALNLMHNNGWLHLDIKVNNILIDDEGYAVLGDLGISQHYVDGKKVTKGGGAGTSGHAAPQQSDMHFTEEFHPELDVYSLAVLLYEAMTKRDSNFFDLDSPECDCISEEAKNALRTAIDGDLETTPKSVLEFIHLLPGCKDVTFTIPEPVDDAEEEEEEDGEDWNWLDEKDGVLDTEDAPKESDQKSGSCGTSSDE